MRSFDIFFIVSLNKLLNENSILDHEYHISLKINFLKFCWSLPGANELMAEMNTFFIVSLNKLLNENSILDHEYHIKQWKVIAHLCL